MAYNSPKMPKSLKALLGSALAYKLVMVGLIFTAMITFVFCAGMGTEQWFQSLLNRFGPQGEGVVEVGGRTIAHTEMDNLKNQRKMANDFMHAFTDETVKYIDKFLIEAHKKKQDAKDDEKTKLKREKELAEIREVRDILVQRLKKPNYFGTGTKLQELIDFLVWRDQADRLGVYLDKTAVQEQVGYLVLFYKYFPSPNHEFLAQRNALKAEAKVREQHQGATTDQIAKALEQEFRVEIAKLALVECRPKTLFMPRLAPFEVDPAVRLSLTPDQLWRTYKKDMTKYDVTLLPVPVEHFVGAVAAPTPGELENLFKKYQAQREDPTRDTPGFVPAEKVRVAGVMAEPDSPHYKDFARGVTTLQYTLPLLAEAGAPGLGGAALLFGEKHAWEAVTLQKGYETEKFNKAHNETLLDVPYVELFEKAIGPQSLTSPKPLETDLYIFQVPLTNPNFVSRMALSQYEPDAHMVSGLVSLSSTGLVSLSSMPLVPAVGGIVGYQNRALQKDEPKLTQAIHEEIDRRLPVGLTLVLSGASPTPTFTTQFLAATADSQIVFLPFSVVEPEIRAKLEKGLAVQQVSRDLETARDDPDLGLQGAQNRPVEMNTRVFKLRQKYAGLEYFETKKAYTPFDVETAPELKKLKAAFERWLPRINDVEGRKGTEKELKDEDFYRLFFETSDHLSAASRAKYVLQQWPPEVEVPARNLLNFRPEDAEHQGEDDAKGKKFNLWVEVAVKGLPDSLILFWRTEDPTASAPKSLDEVKDKVIHAWKFKEARDTLALTKAVKIAEQVNAKSNLDPKAILLEQAKKLKVEPLSLTDVSALKPVRATGAPQDYVPYTLPKGLIRYPRKDTVAQLLALTELKEPLVTAKKDDKSPDPADDKLDKANKELFQAERAKEGVKHQVQILTDRPRSTYYVAVVTSEHAPERDEFLRAYRGTAGNGPLGNNFVKLAHDAASRAHLEAVTSQLRQAANVQAKNTKGFD